MTDVTTLLAGIKERCSFEGCDREFRARGLCAVHYNQSRAGLELVPLPGGRGYQGQRSRSGLSAEDRVEAQIDRFWSKVNKTDGCWEWMGFKNPSGYGSVWWSGATRRPHRIAFAIANGTIPAGMEIDHICHNRICVRPEHLRAVTPKQNQENRSGAPSNSSSGILGVFWYKKTRKWRAAVKHEYKNYYLGLFTNIEEAEAAVIAKRNELFTHNDRDRKSA